MKLMSTTEMNDLIKILINYIPKEFKEDVKELSESLMNLVSSKGVDEDIKIEALNKFIFTCLIISNSDFSNILTRVNIDWKNYKYNLKLSNSSFLQDLALLKSLTEKMDKKYKIGKLNIINLFMLFIAE